MAKAVLTTKVDPSYDDLPADRYHFPRTYLNTVRKALGDWIVYYEPRRISADLSGHGGRQAYFATARIASVRPDPHKNGHYYADIADYHQFDRPVPFRERGYYYESRLQKDDGSTNKGMFGRSVRLLEESEYQMILAAGFRTGSKRRKRIGISTQPSPRTEGGVCSLSVPNALTVGGSPSLASLPITDEQRSVILEQVDAHLPGTEIWLYPAALFLETQSEPHVTLVALTSAEEYQGVSTLRRTIFDHSPPLGVSVFAWQEIPRELQAKVQNRHRVLRRAVGPPGPMGRPKDTRHRRTQLVSPTASSPWPHYFGPTDRPPLVPAGVLRALWLSECPTDEVNAVAINLGERNRNIVLWRLGAMGQPIPTYASIANQFGISRARIGQIIARFLEEVAEWGIRLPWSEYLLVRIQDMTGRQFDLQVPADQGQIECGAGQGLPYHFSLADMEVGREA